MKIPLNFGQMKKNFFVKWIKKNSNDLSTFVNLVFSTIGLNKWQLLHQTVTNPAAPLQCLTDHCGFRLGALTLTVRRAGLSVLSSASVKRAPCHHLIISKVDEARCKNSLVLFP